MVEFKPLEFEPSRIKIIIDTDEAEEKIVEIEKSLTGLLEMVKKTKDELKNLGLFSS
jgi:hypothetical protein